MITRRSYMFVISLDKVLKYTSKGLSEKEAFTEILANINNHFIYKDIEYKKFKSSYHVYLIKR